MTAAAPLRSQCGQLIVGGFATPALSQTFKDALARGERGGAILFRRNLTGSLTDALALTRAIADAAPTDLPPLIAVDQEGGRVTRFGTPVLRLPPMRAFGRLNDEDLVRRAARVLGAQLAALGFTMDFAPVLDVDTCPTNPIIGDRSFSADPAVVARLGRAFAAGLEDGGVMACGKHFPGHGDTTVDSHLDLPHVAQPRSRLDLVELAPFRQLRANACAALMTAHVVYPALDEGTPATLSRRIAHDLLREELGFDGLLVSDDLEMKAVFDRHPIEESAVLAVRAGCDVLLVCSSEDLQARAHEALVRAAERDSAFRAQVTASAARGLEARRKHRPRPVSDEALVALVAAPDAVAMAEELQRRGAFA
jgi:beta-N-acetylhexosaminidase